MPSENKTNLMHSMFPALAGTFIIDLNEETGYAVRTPVVAWAPDAENPYRAPCPMTMNGVRNLVGKAAVEFPDGMVHSPSFSLPFADAAEWLAWATKTPAKATTSENHKRPAAATDPGETSDEDPGYGIKWAKAPYKTNAFYRYETEEYDFLFIVEPGTIPPEAVGPVTKIKRDEFMKLKKELDVVDVADLTGGSPQTEEEPEETEEDETEDLI